MFDAKMFPKRSAPWNVGRSETRRVGVENKVLLYDTCCFDVSLRERQRLAANRKAHKKASFPTHKPRAKIQRVAASDGAAGWRSAILDSVVRLAKGATTSSTSLASEADAAASFATSTVDERKATEGMTVAHATRNHANGRSLIAMWRLTRIRTKTRNWELGQRSFEPTGLWIAASRHVAVAITEDVCNDMDACAKTCKRHGHVMHMGKSRQLFAHNEVELLMLMSNLMCIPSPHTHVL